MRQPPVQIVRSSTPVLATVVLCGVLLTGCARSTETSDITTGSISAPVSAAVTAELPPSVPGEGLEARLARLEYDLAQLKLDYSIVRPSFEQLVSRETELTDRLAALEGALGPVTASIPIPRTPARSPSEPTSSPAPSKPGPANATAQPSPSGQVGLHLASYRNLDRLKEGWAELRAAHPSELTGLDVRVQRIDTGKNGVFRRLLAGPVNSRTAADGLCRALSAKGVYCKTVTFSGNAL